MTEQDQPKIHVPAALAIVEVPIADLPDGTLNALLCKHLLNWKSVGHSFDGEDVVAKFNVWGVNDKGVEASVPNLCGSVRQVPAMLEAVIARGYKPTMHFSGRHWHAWIRTDPPGKADASAETIQMAVARAALDGCLGRNYAEIPRSRTREWKAMMREQISESLKKEE